MRAGLIPETLFERVLVKLNIFPAPLLDTHFAFLTARVIMIATKIGAFDVLKEGPRSAVHVAKACGTHPAATERLLNALVSAKYLRAHHDGYELRPVARKWLLKDSPSSIRNKMLFHFTEWDVTEKMDDFVQTGTASSLHAALDGESWDIYQRAMKELAGTVAAEMSGRASIPKGATRLLDIGGSHGFYSVAFCRRHPGLSAVVLDLPEAVKASAPLLAEDFAATSSSGTWSIDEMQSWQSAAGLKTLSPIWSRIVPGIALVPARKALA